MKKVLNCLILALVLAVVSGCTQPAPAQPPAPAAVSTPTPVRTMQQPGVTTTTAIPEKTASVSDNTITIKDFAFNPPAMTVRAGATVRWVNADSATHRIQARGDIISPLLSSGQSWSRIFDQAGTYEYTCTIHPSMHGTLVVE